ncbi:MAG: enoyl-CoA hydratase-related protein [Bacteroidetes bacterium]|jgi:enoyl-CoA hydratase|nr:enoyl-CoA hydratase-related protein [Bacteroidota bacterium]MDF1867574.1 enoyl-CoA hydratase-related protein [Saprospiraceae bacterium]
MTYQNLLITEEEGILIVTLNRPKALNAINDLTMQELGQFFSEDAPKRSNIKGIILTGAGDKSFVAGADIKEFLALDVEKATNKSRTGNNIFFSIERFPKPVIAAVQGFALGAGCELAMACHMRIAGEKARFGQPEVNLGIIPGYGGTQRLVQYIGKGKALELLLTADMIGAEEAYRLGLANHVVPAGEEITKAKEIINKIGKKGPIAVAKCIEAVNAYFQYDADGYEKEITEFGNAAGTVDFKEGAGAFIEKRRANFVGK